MPHPTNELRIQTADGPVVTAERWNGGPHPALLVNEGDRETVMESSDGERYAVPAGCGLLMTLVGPKLVRPGQWIVTGIKGGKGAKD